MMHSDSTDLQYADSSGYAVETDKPLGAAGLRNLGNTCYMNAALQSISNCPHLTEFLLQCPGLIGEPEPRLAALYQNFLAQLWLPPGCTHSVPIRILREVQCLHPMFMGYGQHDAQEFLRVFLNRLHDELKTSNLNSCTNPKGLKAESGDTGSTDSGFASSATSVSCECDHSVQRGKAKQKKNRQKHGPSDKRTCHTCARSAPTKTSCNGVDETIRADTDGRSIITDVFQGKLISAVRCLSCNELSCREEPFMDLSLSLQRPESVRSPDSQVNTEALAPTTFQFKSDPSRRSRPSSGTTRLTPHADLAHISPSNASSKSKTPSVRENSRARPSHRTLPLNVWLPLAPFSYPVSLAVRLFAQLFALFAISWAWVTSRMNYVRGWVYQPTLTLEDCLADYFSQAELNGDNKYSCERCKRLCNGINQYALLSLPEILCVHLKRFRSHYTDTSKINVAVTFPMHDLDLSPFLHEDCTDEVTTYDLISVICHHGGYGGGHYITYALNRHNGKWYEFDDDLVTERDSEQVAQLTSEAYMLLYRKRDTLLSGLRNEAELLLQEHAQIPSDRTVYISRPWFVRFHVWAEPGPITNTEFLCEHGNVQPQLWPIRDSLLFPIPERLWFRLLAKFGGDPIVRNPIPCPKCRDAIIARRERECDAFEKMCEKEATNCHSCGIYAISTCWFNTWEKFVRGDTFNIPGPIDNSMIVKPRPVKTRLASTLANEAEPPRLKMGADYRELFEGCWNLLFEIYGGGPAVCLRASTPSSLKADDRVMDPRDFLDVRDERHCSPIHGLMGIAESDPYVARDASDFYACASDLAVDVGSTQLNGQLNDDQDLSPGDFQNFTEHPDLEPNGKYRAVNGEVNGAIKSELIITRSAENLSLTYQGDTIPHSLDGIRCNGSWHSQSAETLFLNNDPPVVVPLMAGDGPANAIDYTHLGTGMTDSNGKRPRLL